jgi:hypothetical protein
MVTSLVSVDRLANGQLCLVGDKIYKKVSDYILSSQEDGKLLFDARLYYKNAEAPLVGWPVEEKQ